MSLIRPELAAAFWRWRETLAGMAVGVFGAVWALWAHGFMAWLAVPVIGLAAALVWIGRQRARFRTAGDGPGVVVVDEGRVAYWGPLTGGTIDIDVIASVALDRTGLPPHWVLASTEGALQVPVTAKGAEALLDVFAGLPGFRTEDALAALHAPDIAVLPIWRREGPAGRAALADARPGD
mgnify:FL=1